MASSFVNGVATDVWPVNHRGLHYGDGVFETIAVKQGRPLLWQRHLDRLKRGVQVLGLNVDFDALDNEVKNSLKTPTSGVLKIVLARDYTPTHSRGYTPDAQAKTTRIVQFSAGVPPVPHFAKLITATQPVACAPNLAGLKTLNALPYVLASQCLLGRDAYDALVCDVAGYVLEGTKTNVFWVNDNNELCTPNLTQVGVAGVVREEILNTLTHTPNTLPNIKSVKLCRARLCEVLQAKAVFVCNSIAGIVPVSHIDDWPVRQDALGAVVNKLKTQLSEHFFDGDLA